MRDINNKYVTYLNVIVMIYVVVASLYSVLRHYMYLSSGYDLGIFMQSLWTTAERMGLLFNTGEWQDIGTYSHFGVHNSPVLLILVPIYKVLPYAETLLIIQPIALGFGAVMLFKFARFVLDDRKAFYIAVMYIVNPFIHGINRFDFHPVSLAVPFIFLIPYYYEKKEHAKLFLVSLVILSVKEDAGLILISLGLMFILRRHKFTDLLRIKNWKHIVKNDPYSALLALMGFLWILFSLLVIIPHYNGGEYPYLSDGKLKRYGSRIYISNVIVYFTVAILSTGFLSILNVNTFLASLPLWFELLPSTKPEMLILGYQYPYMLIPMLFILSVYNLKDVKSFRLNIGFSTNNREKRYNFEITLKKIVAMTIVVTLIFSPMFHVVDVSPYVRGKSFYELGALYREWGPYFNVLDNIVMQLSETDCIVTTQNMVFPHLANRVHTYYIVTPFESVYVPNGSVVLVVRSLPDYNITMEYFHNYTALHNVSYTLLDANAIMLSCYNKTGDNYTKFINCIDNKVETVIHQCSGDMR